LFIFEAVIVDDVDEVVDVDVDVVDVADGLDGVVDRPFTWPLAVGAGEEGFAPSDLIGCEAAGDEEIVAEGSSIDPNVTAEPCFTVPTLLLGMLTASFTGIPWPRLLARRECVCVVVDTFVGAGDPERGVGAEEFDWGGPFAQADFVGSWVGGFGAEAVEDLLIEFLPELKVVFF
jgi:hypothetical protein